ncbi:galactose-specific lectin nattectin-like [Lates calcarifer]|uniref:Galactose-specific lectin nattectin-like n=1 Tax=Lates calcarifer TaxID=8187 RepID=A0AAJ8DQ87_LATCA|nr:galactose-specific lectin nattectin-like [Lates calcarifer]
MASAFHLVFLLCLSSGLLVSGSSSVRTKRWVGGCPSGWTRYGQRCFFVDTRHLTMAEAELSCISHGGNLASIHSSWENLCIRHLIYQTCRAYVTAWIGLFDAIQEGKWMWTDGSRVAYTSWGSGEPNNVGHGGEHCTEINWGGSHYWNDIPCHFRKPFVCARKL